jgi:methyl-accepting chemotaxis protein
LFSGFVCYLHAAAEDPKRPDDQCPVMVDGRVALRAVQGLVEEHLAGILRLEKVLAATSDARSARWEALKPALKILDETMGTDAAVWFALPDGRYYTVAGDLATETLQGRDYFPRLLAGEDVLGSLIISRSTGHRSIVVATPIIENQQIVGAIGVSIRTRLISRLVDQHSRFPENLYFYALARDQQIAIHRHPDKLFKHPAEIDPRLQAVFDPLMTQDEGQLTYALEGQLRQGVFQKSTLTGWRFFLVQEEK